MQDTTPLAILLPTAVTLAAGHTLIGLDHTLPFVAMARARGWTLRKTLLVTALCGAGHVLSSVALGAVGIALGVAAHRLQWVQGARGSLAAWSLIAFGLFFVVRGLVRSQRARAHSHAHAHADGVVHAHEHHHAESAHVHPHVQAGVASATVWTLFVIFVLGPCEPLIPLLIAPAALGDWLAVALIVGAFGAVTVGAMLALVAAGHLGASRLQLRGLERHAELLAGVAIAGSGLAVQWLGI